MGSLIIACRTLKDEVNQVLRETGLAYPVIWIDSGLHTFPEQLRDTVQQQIDRITNVETLILVFGNCGNALTGIRSQTAQIVIPRVDDCITLLLGSLERRRELAAEGATYFFTRGWIVEEMNILKEYEHCVAKFGPQKAERIMKMLLKHYKRFMVLDTGAYPLDDECLNRPREMAAKFNLEYQVGTGTLAFLKKLLCGPWDETIKVLPPGEVLTLEDFGLSGSQGSPAGQLSLGTRAAT